MTVPAVFHFVQRNPAAGPLGLAPVMPLTLMGVGGASRDVSGLLDTGAAINVLPLSIGVDLGLDWNAETNEVELTGNLAIYEAHAVVVNASTRHSTPSDWCLPGPKPTTFQ